MSLVLGSHLGAYKILGMLGAGGMGEVYRAQDGRLGRDVAIKVLPSAFAKEQERLQRFQQEARVVSALNHPNILTIHSMDILEDTLCLISEMLEGETLRECMNRKPLPAKKCIDIALQIAQGLAAAHGKGIIHRDLKPENIFITKDNLVKILDFGLAKWQAISSHLLEGERVTPNAQLPLKTVEGRILGTVSYMSPEQLQAQKLDGRSDIFSLGIMLWEMLTGTRPFQGTSNIEVMTAILKDEPPELDSALKIPPGMVRLLYKCLAKNVDARFYSAHDLAFALEEVSKFTMTSLSLSHKRFRLKETHSRKYVISHGFALLAGAMIVGLFAAPFSESKFSPVFKRLSFKNLLIHGCRFMPDGKNFLYSAVWNKEPWQVNICHVDTLEERPVGPSAAQVMAVSPKGQIAYGVGIQNNSWDYFYPCTLAISPRVGSFSPKVICEHVEWADYGPTEQLAVVTHTDKKYRLEYPMGTVRVETNGWISHVRVSHDGQSIAYIAHPFINDNVGHVCVWRQEGNRVKKMTHLWDGGIMGLAWHGEEIWFTASEGNAAKGLWKIDKSGHVKKMLNVPIDFLLYDISPQGEALMVRDDFRVGIVTGTLGSSAVQELGVQEWTVPGHLSRDGKLVVVEEQSLLQENGYRVYLKSVDGKNTTFLGEGTLGSISSDQRFVAVVQTRPMPHPVLLPLGPEPTQHLDSFGIKHYVRVAWTLDGNLIVQGSEENHGLRLYLQDLHAKTLQVLHELPDDYNANDGWMELSPDGSTLAFGDGSSFYWLGIQDPSHRVTQIKTLASGDNVLGWCADGHSLFVAQFKEDPVCIWRFDIPSGKRHLHAKLDLKEIPALSIRQIFMTPDGKTWLLRYRKNIQDLYCVSGLKS